MARGAMGFIYLLAILTLYVVPNTVTYPARIKEEFDPRIMPVEKDTVDTVVNTSTPVYKPDPLENIGVEISQGFLIEGDIRIWHGAVPLQTASKDTTSNQESFNKQVTNSHQIRNLVSTEEIWSEKVIPYEIDPVFNSTEKQTILNAMEEVMTGVNRCIQFLPREKQDDFLYIDGHNSGCSSDIGKKGGKQSVSISRASECVSKGIIMHELLHALGLWHEHSRMDRDTYIEIISHNILPGHEGDFNKNPNAKLLTTYDYYSIMHYKTNQFSKFAMLLDTIRIKQPGVDVTKVGQREYLSDKDKEKISILYQCRKGLRTSANTSQSNLLSGMIENEPRPTIGNQRLAFGGAEPGRVDDKETVFTLPSKSSFQGNNIELVITPIKTTIKTNTEVVSDTVSTRKQDLARKINETDTTEIGKK